MSIVRGAPIALAILLLACPATAEESPRAARPHPVATVSLDVSGLNLVAPALRPTIDLRLASRWSLTLATGFGARQTEATDTKPTASTLCWDAAARGHYFVLGTFEHGVHVGAAITFARVKDGPVQHNIAEPPLGLAAGPTLGFKSTRVPLVDVGVEVGPLFRLVTPSAAYHPSSVELYAALLLGHSF